MMFRSVILVAIFLTFLNSLKADIDEDWWKNAVVYQIYPKSFKDSNNDGYGDLQGIISKLQHLKNAGVTVAWLSPIYKSPQVDDGYDISDFKDVDPVFGTLDDFDQLVGNASEYGIKVVMDLVPNHSSDKHEWFLLSENRTEGYENYYVWADKNATTQAEPNNWLSVFKNSMWSWSDTREQYYLHQYSSAQPDLNYNENAVKEEMKNIMLFWLDRGIAGFRVDAVSHIFETGLEDEPESGTEGVEENEYNYLNHIYTLDQPETIALVYEWREILDEYSNGKGDYSRIMMTETGSPLNYVMQYYGNEETGQLGAHFSFNFRLLGSFDNARDIVDAINKWEAYMPTGYVANWLTGNHDNSRVATRNGPDNVDGFNMLIAMLPGVLVTYNGEEIGQENGEVSFEDGRDPSACDVDEDYYYANSRDFARTPFHWDNSTNAGFNEGAKTWLPVSEKYFENNLAAQAVDDAKSHFHVYQKMIDLRNEPAFVSGYLKIRALSDNVLGLTKTIYGGNSYTLVMNIASSQEAVDLKAAFSSLKSTLEVVVTSVNSSRFEGEQVNAENLQLDPYESLVLLQTVDDDGDTNSTTTSSPTTTTTTEKPDSNNMAMSMSVSLLVLLIASVETVLNLL